METMKKLLKSGQTLIFTSIVLMFAIFVYFTNNFGYGWFAQNDNVSANGMWVKTAEMDSPIESYEFYKVYDVKTTVEDVNGTPDNLNDDEIFDRYAFTALGANEVAQMNLGTYNKLDRPTYHVLLHISVKDNAQALYIDANIRSGNTKTINKSDLPNMVANETPIGLSAAMEFFNISPSTADDDIVTWNEEYKKDESSDPASVFVFDNHDLLSENGKMFALTETSGALIYSSVKNMFTIDVSNSIDVDEDGLRDVFIFMTYNAGRVNLLQDNAIIENANMGDKDMQFTSDFFLHVSGAFVKNED